MTGKHNIRDTIIDAAVALGERSSWEAVRLYDVAAELNISLDEIRLHFREKEDLVDAWFDRADSTMLKEAQAADFMDQTSQQRLHRLIMTWLGALSIQRKVTTQMIGAKMEPGHLHIQIPALMRVSRTVQWIREGARRDATFIRRALEESALTMIYLATFMFWMKDESDDSQLTGSFLTQKLSVAGSLDTHFYGGQSKAAASHPSRQLESLPVNAD